MGENNQEYVLGLDLDQTGLNYAKGIQSLIMDKNVHLSEEDFPEMSDYCFVESKWPTLKTISDYADTHVNGVEMGFFRTLEAYENFPDTINMLRDNGVIVRVITHRLFTGSSYAKSVSHTAESLESLGVGYDEICFAKRKSDMRCDSLVDDSPKNIREWREINNDNNPCFIFDQPYNREFEGPRANNWKDLGTMILKHKESLGK